MQNNLSQSGRKWIFIRGLARHSGYWSYFVRFFKRSFPNDEIELIDLPGNGTERNRDSLLKISEIVEDLRRRSQNLPKYKKIHLLTISLGSMIGVEWARKYPDEVTALICINTSDKGTSSFYERMQPGMMKNIIKMIKSSEHRNIIQEETISEVAKNTEEAEYLRTEFNRYPPPTIQNFFRQLIAAGSYSFPKIKPKVPILFLRSLGDKLCHPVCTERICQMWDLDYKTHATGAHDLLLYEPQWICDEVGSFLKES